MATKKATKKATGTAKKKGKAGKKKAKRVSSLQRARSLMSREAKDAYGEIQAGVKSLERSIAEVQRGVRRAERKIQADAGTRIRQLRKEARAQLGVLQEKEREAERFMKKLTVAAGESWREIKEAADAILAEARSTAAGIVERFRDAFGS
jgi:hypothetical protein